MVFLLDGYLKGYVLLPLYLLIRMVVSESLALVVNLVWRSMSLSLASRCRPAALFTWDWRAAFRCCMSYFSWSTLNTMNRQLTSTL